MPRGPELSPQMRSRLCELNSIGYGAKRISKIHPEIPLSTIKYTLRKEAIRKNNISMLRSGQPRKLSEEQRDSIYDLTEHNPDITHKDLLALIDYAIKERALRVLLREMNKRKWKKLRRPQIQTRHAEARRAWAERYRDLDWRRVKWSDECMVRRGQGQRPQWSFLRPIEQLEQGDVQVVSGQGIVRQMFWAAFGNGKRTGLVALDGNVDSQGIYDLYNAYLPDFLEANNIFMHDNASVHTAGIVKELLRERGYEIMIWPPLSPDLNPIENVWALMKAKIYEIDPALVEATDTVETYARLREVAKEAWHAIEQDIHDKLCDTMNHRVEAILRCDGWYTKY